MIFKPFMREAFMPLPITFISTVSKSGIRNIAPYSCIMPVLRPLDLICVATAARRDTLDNINETGQFVVNMVGADFADKVIPTAKHLPPEADEFDTAGISQKPSEKVKPPGIAGAFAWMECEKADIHTGKGYLLIMGKVLHLEVDDAVLTDENRLDTSKARPLMMTGSKKGMHYSTIADLYQFDPFGAMFPDGHDPLAKMG